MAEKIWKNYKWWLIVVVVIFIIIGGASFAYFNTGEGAVDSKDSKEMLVEIPSGATTSDIASLLKSKKLISNTVRFKIMSKLKNYDGQYQAGVYVMKKSMASNELARLIIDGKTANRMFTIPEGDSIEKMAARLEKHGIVSQDEFLKEIKTGKFDYEFLPEVKPNGTRLEGYLFPDTYAIPLDVDAHKLIKIFLDNYQSKYEKTIKPMLAKSDKSLDQVMIVASIVEREAMKQDERPKVAGVIYNRLNKKMPLQMCSTIQYALKDDKLQLTYEDIKFNSPYNTYEKDGLPPGAICSPGMSAIKAAIVPTKTEYLYFVVDKKLDGSQAFSKDYEKFLKDKEDYYKALEERGIE